MAKYVPDKDGELKKLAEEFHKLGSADELRAANDAAAEAYVQAIEEQAPISRKSLPMPMVIGIISLVVLIIAFVGIFMLHGNDNKDLINVPKLTGLDVRAARAKIAESGLRVRINYDETSKESTGKVLSQRPTPGTRAAAGDPVTIFIAGKSPGGTQGQTPANTTQDPQSGRTQPPSPAISKLAVPDVIDMLDSKAKATLEGLGLIVTVTTVADPSKPERLVIACDPKPGTSVAAGSTVTISVNAPPKAKPAQAQPVVVSDYTGRTAREALQDIQKQGLTPQWREEQTSQVTAGYVIRTEPPAGTQLPPGSNVIVVVAK